MIEFDKDNIVLRSSERARLESIIRDDEFEPQFMRSNFGRHACTWVKNLALYDEQMKLLRPKIARLRELESKIEQRRDEIKGKGDEINVML